MDATSPARAKPATIGKTRRRTRLPFLIADGYLFGEVASATLRGLGWFGGLLMAFAVIAAVRRVVDNSISWAGMLEMIAYSMPRIILFTLPMSVLYGTVQAFSDLSAKGEVIALWAGGMGLPRMLRAPLIWGVLLAIMAFWVQEAMVPMAEREKKNALVRHAIQAVQVQENFKHFDYYDDGAIKRVTQAKRFDPKTKTLVGPSIQILKKDGSLSQELVAERAVWNIETGKWKFFKLRTRTAAASTGDTFDMPGEYEELEIDTDEGAPDPKLLGEKQATLLQNLQQRNFEMVSIGDLRDYRRELNSARKSATGSGVRAQQEQRILGATFGIHDKIATPLIAVALVLIGVPLGIRPQRSGGGFAMGISLVVVLLYYVIWTWVSQIGKAGLYNPYILAYLPLTIILGIAVIMLRKKS